MFRHASTGRAPGLTRRAALRLGAALAVAAGSLVAPSAASPAYAIDLFNCTGAASVFNSTTTGALVRRDLNSPGTTLTSWGTAKTIGSGWQTFGRILGGPDGRVYGINSSGLTRYRWTGTAWEFVDGKQTWLIDTGFTQYGTAEYRNKITVDETGDFYAIDSAGKLRWYRFDETARKWTVKGRVLDTGWDKYDALVATGPGVLFARTPAGGLYRYWFDTSSERWLRRNQQLSGANFADYTKGFFSVGGDTVFGIQSNGDLYQLRLMDDRTSTVMRPDLIGSGWAGFPNVFATTNTCHQGSLTSPAKPSTPTQQNSPLSVMQAPAVGTALGTIEYAYTDNIGTVRHGRQTSPDNFNSIQWNPVDNVEAYTGKPALVADSQKRVNLYAHQTNSDVRSLTQTEPGSPSWNAWAGLVGAMKSEPSVVKLSDDSLAVFALDSGGILWARPQDGSSGDLLPWTKLGGSGLTGTPVVNAGLDGSATIFATDSTGAVVTATYQNRTLTSDFTSIGDTGFTGNPAVVMMPGRRAMVFALNTDGILKKKYQNTDGTWSGTWSIVGTGAITPAGTPTAILDPNLGRILVVTRTTTNDIYYAWETGQGTEVWGNWTFIGASGAYPVDPTTFSYQGSNGIGLAFVSRTVNGTLALFAADPNTMARTTAPTFTQVKIPQPRGRR